MTRDAAAIAVCKILTEQLGANPAFIPTALVVEQLGATSLDLASLQLAFEDAFGLKFSDGGTRGPIDLEWDACKTVDDFVSLVARNA
jgi:acyl carrier protein